MFYVAQEAAAKSTSTYTPWDIFMILFTILIAFGVYRSWTSKDRNMFAVGFGVVSLAVFLFLDVLMIMGWFGHLDA